MKTLEEIKKLTKTTQKKQDREAKIAAKKAKEAALKEKKETHEKIREYFYRVVTKDIPASIEKNAAKGYNSYNFEIMMYNSQEKDAQLRLFKKYVKKHLSDFNPRYWEKEGHGCEYNYDGCSIDGTEYTYWTPQVEFSW
jgi:hypothetical protein